MKPIYQCGKPGQPCHTRMCKSCIGCKYRYELTPEKLQKLSALISSHENKPIKEGQ